MLNPVTQSSCGTGNTITESTKENGSKECDDGCSTQRSITNCAATSQVEKTQDDIMGHNLNGSIGKWMDIHKWRSIESEPYPRDSMLRKHYAGKDKNLPKELKELFTPLKCNLCHCSMSSTVTAKDHYEGKKHISNIKKWFVEHPEYNDRLLLTDIIQQKIIDSDRLYCKYCDVLMSSEQQAQSHYTGKKHQTVMNSGIIKSVYLNCKTGQYEKSLGKKADSSFDICDRVIEKEKRRKDPAANQRFFCDTCQVPCPSQITYNDHLAGAKHKKNMIHLLDREPSPLAKDNILEDVLRNEKKPTSPADLSIYRTPSGKYYCHSCNVTVNSPVQFLQHSDSKKHKHKSILSANKLYK